MGILLGFLLFLTIQCFLSPETETTNAFRKMIQQPGDHSKTTSPICSACHTFFRGIQRIPNRAVPKLLSAIATEVCVAKKIEDRDVCRGAVGEMIDYIVSNLWMHKTDPHFVCHKLQMCPKEYQTLTVDDYAKEVLAGKPNKTQEEPTGRKTLNILHWSDLHPDLFYQEGMPTVCGEPVCCRTDVKAQNDSKPAGFWGSNAQCDIPLRTINLLVDRVKSMNVDMVIWTGDNTAHDIWKQSQSYNLNFTTLLSELFKKHIKVPVMPSLGNHESYPVNVYQWGKGNSIELNEGVAQAWGDWIGPEATETLRQKGYFSTYLKAYNLRVISLNTQAGNDENWVLLKDPTDPGKHLEWLRNELDQAQKLKQFVYIIGHIPPLDNLEEWGARYNILIDRYSYTIRGQFFGHTHDDHMSFFTAVGDSTRKIINNYMVAPSFTTSTHRNPRFRIMKVDLDTMRVVDFDQYKINLQRNWTKEQIPEIQPDYSFLKEYGLPSFSFEQQEKFRNRLENDAATQTKYTFHQYGGIKPGFAGKQVGCSTRTTRSLQASCLGTPYKKTLIEKQAGPWRKLIA